ncbi:hypothetical protein [Neptuniibacter caesariensis]|uniref:Uncharacterized protein n=1 Tax=Neptuniibacter caesariensis TaxID=207954 RepID=A0A7U8C2B2_NEPCE|nr:hypothetical protein [Neptuniibacter caesariensis]EAR59566.1 hypothetical protein MED92_11634 [Oceanospirillum sp. MED92] [Neptuniibacter caesariensis]
MELVESGIAVLIFLSIGAFGIYQARKTRRHQSEYKKLLEDEKVHLDKIAWDAPKLFAYSKPMSKGMWVSSLIGVFIFIWALLESAAL